MKQNTIIYPFDWESLPLLTNNALPEYLNVFQCISPAGWGYAGRDAGSINLGAPLGITVSTDFDTALEQADTVLFSKSIHKLDSEIHVLPKIKQAIRAKKNVICVADISKENHDSFVDTCRTNERSFSYYNNNFDHVANQQQILKENTVHLKKIFTPIVMIFGLTQRVGKFDTELKLTNHFQKSGYKPALVSSRSYGKLCNFISAPFFLFSKEFTSAEKIVLFNHYIKSIEKEYSPDVIIIGVPGGLMPVTKRDTRNFGDLAYKMTRAVTPDISIVCTYSAQFTSRYFEKLAPILEYRFSASTPLFQVDSIMLDFISGDTTTDEPTFTYVENDVVATGIPQEVKSFVFSKEKHDELFATVVNKLATYGELEAL